MKTKLSFLALPLCLGMVLALVLAACSDGGKSPNGPQPSLSSSGGVVYQPSSEVKNEQVVFSENFGVSVEFETVVLTGTISSPQTAPIVRLEFTTSQAGWVSYKGTLVNGPISVNTPLVKLNDAEIDLKNPNIPCGVPQNLSVKACLDANCSPNKYSTRNGSFEKPAHLCAALSSSAGAPSSSSSAVWKFGQSTVVDALSGTPITIGTGSILLYGDNSTQPDMKVTNGKIRRAGAIEDDDVIPGKAYSSDESVGLGTSIPTLDKLDGDDGLQNGEYYMVYLNDNSRYLVQFTPKTTWGAWPKTCTYWLATESPNQ